MHTLDFIWLELTSRCNLQCIHCYAESSPKPSIPNTLSEYDYINLITAAASLGCQAIQFIGGEPTLVPYLRNLISHARTLKYTTIEVYTNAIYLNEELLKSFVDNNVSVAVSFYSDDASIHDSITGKSGSHGATVKNIKRLIDAMLDVRVGVVLMPANQHRLQETTEFLKLLGVNNIGHDRVRAVGRGLELTSQSKPNHAPDLSELCGKCWQGSLAIGPDGLAAPCIMSRNWAVGSVLKQSLSDILQSQRLSDVRQEIYKESWLAKNSPSIAGESSSEVNCNPDCAPWMCNPECTPRCSPSCKPCFPFGKCQPQLTPSC